MKKILLLLSIFILTHINLYSNEVLRWAADAEGNAPYIFQDPRVPTNLIGFEVEIAELLAKAMNRRPVFVQNQWDGLIPGLSRNDYDIAINGLEITDDRRHEVLFSNPYYLTYEQLVVRQDNSNILSLSDLVGKKAGALKFSLAERILLAKGGIEVLSYQGEVNAFEDLKNGRIEAVLVDAPIALYHASWNSDYKLVGQPIGEVSYGIVVHKNNQELMDEVNSALARIASDGSLRNVLERWNLWNYMMALYLDDITASKVTPIMYEQYIAWQGQELTFWQKLNRYKNFLPLLGRGALMTIQITIPSMLIAMFVGLVLVFMRIYMPLPFSSLAVLYIEVVRGTPLLIQLFFIFYALPAIGIKLSPFIAAILGLGLNYAAYEAENYRSGLASVTRGQLEAAYSLGMRRSHALRFVVFPQAFRIVIPPVTNDFISLLKDSSLVSVITMVELTKVYGQLASTYYDYFGTGIIVAIIYFLLGLPFVKLSKFAERRLAIEKIKNE